MRHNYLKAGILYLLVFLCGVSTSLAQTTINGKVTAQEDGAALPGVSVSVKGTTRGTTTNSEGQYTLAVTNSDAVLVFSFIGFLSQEVSIGNRTAIDVQLASDLTSLSEVVVTGYTTENRKEITGAVSTVKGKELASVPMQNAEQQLQGRVAGVTVLTSGQPGTTSQVRIRGFGSFLNNNPLYIVDGVPTYNIGFLNSFEIDNMTVLKDAGAASIYGARASAGVIIVTTKHAKPGSKINVTYDAFTGVSTPGDGFSFLNPQEQANYTWTALKNGGKELKHPQYGTGATPTLPDFLLVGTRSGLSASQVNLSEELAKANVNFDNGDPYLIIRTNRAGTNWYDEVTRNAPINNHSLGISGGGENSRFYIGMSYMNNQGIVLNQYAKRYTLRANTDFTLKKIIRIGTNVQATYGNFSLTPDNGEGTPIGTAFRMSPAIPVYDEAGNFAGTRAPGFNNPRNPVAAQVRAKDNQASNLGLFGNVYAEVDLLPRLTYRSSFGGDVGYFYFQNYTARQYENSENNGSSQLAEGAGTLYNWVFTNTVQYSHTFGVHSLKGLLGVEALRTDVGRSMEGSGLNPYTTDVAYRTITGTDATGRQVNSRVPDSYDRRLYSLFGKIDYALKEKYLASFIMRRDASSAFGSENRVGYFPAVTAGWRISEESFLQGTSWIGDLKIRGGWGLMGGQGIPPNNQFTLYGANPSYFSYDITGSNTSVRSGLSQTTLGNIRGGWEKNETVNVGFEATLFSGGLEVIFDWYQRKTSDLLFNPQAPAVVGSAGTLNAPYINIGTMENKGIDLQIIKQGAFLSGDFKYEANLVFTSYNNKITKIADNADYFDAFSGTNRLGAPPVRNAVGQAISSFFGYEVQGLWQSQQEVDQANAVTREITKDPQATFQDAAAPGRFRFRDVNSDGRITAADRTFIGNPNPDFSYGLNLKLGYKNFEIETNFYGVQGNEVFNYSKWYTNFYPSFSGQAIGADVRNAWTPGNTSATTPIFEDASNFSTNTQVNSYYVENGSYLRMRNLQLAYYLPSGILNKWSVEKLKIYVQAINLFTATKYSGLDPGVSGVDTNFGIDHGFYPMTRQFNVGFNLAF